MKRCIVSVSTGDFYGEKMRKQTKSMYKSITRFIQYINGQANIEFTDGKQGIDHIRWSGDFPLGSRSHQESPYGFKVHAMSRAAALGYTSILWLDSPAYAVKEDISPIFEKMEKEGYYVMSHTDPLCNCVGDDVLIKFQVTQDQLNKEGLNLPSGSCYGFDLNHYKGNTLFNNMLLHEKEGLFFSKDGRHRHDEAVLALNMRRLGFPVFFNDPLFQSESKECVIKSGDGQPE